MLAAGTARRSSRLLLGMPQHSAARRRMCQHPWNPTWSRRRRLLQGLRLRPRCLPSSCSSIWHSSCCSASRRACFRRRCRRSRRRRPHGGLRRRGTRRTSRRSPRRRCSRPRCPWRTSPQAQPHARYASVVVINRRTMLQLPRHHLSLGPLLCKQDHCATACVFSMHSGATDTCAAAAAAAGPGGPAAD